MKFAWLEHLNSDLNIFFNSKVRKFYASSSEYVIVHTFFTDLDTYGYFRYSQFRSPVRGKIMTKRKWKRQTCGRQLRFIVAIRCHETRGQVARKCPAKFASCYTIWKEFVISPCESGLRTCNFATRAYEYRAVLKGLQKQLMIMETAFVSYLAAIGQKHDYDS